MSYRFAFFDADCRDFNRTTGSLDFRPRVLPLAGRLEELYSLIDRHRFPFVFTTCCSGSMPSANELSDVLHVPLESSNRTWQQNLSKYRAFYLAKKTYGDPKLNLACRAFDMFQDNQNASRLIRALDVDTWVAFGNGFDLCVNAAASGILKTGAKLIVLSDIRISSASGTPESEKATMAALVNAGAKVMLFDDLRAILN